MNEMNEFFSNLYWFFYLFFQLLTYTLNFFQGFPNSSWRSSSFVLEVILEDFHRSSESICKQ